jgi:hypothetical protein
VAQGEAEEREYRLWLNAAVWAKHEKDARKQQLDAAPFWRLRRRRRLNAGLAQAERWERFAIQALGGKPAEREDRSGAPADGASQDSSAT